MNARRKIFHLFPFWAFVLFFKFGAGLHFTLLSWLGSFVAPVWMVGVIIGIAAFVELLLDVPMGYLLDRVGYKRMLRWGTLAFIGAGLMLLLPFTLVTFLISVSLGCVGWLIYLPGTSAYVLSSSPRNAGGRFMGLYEAVGSAGIVLAAAIIGIVVAYAIPTIGIIIIAILSIALFFIYLSPTEERSVHIEKTSEHQSYYVRRHFIHHVFTKLKELSPALSVLLLENTAASLFYGAIWFVVPLILASNIHSEALGLGLSIFDLSVVVLGSVIGKIADRWGGRHLVFIGMLLFAGTASVIGFNLNIWFLVLGFLATTGDEISGITLWSWINRLDKKHTDDGLINGAVACFSDLGWTIGPVLAGALYGIVGPEWAITISAIPIGVLWLYFSVSSAFSYYFRQKLPIEHHERIHRSRHHR